MTDKQKIAILKKCFEDTIWMAIRYAHGRHTYAPDMVREAFINFKKVFPEYSLKKDITIQPPDESTLGGYIQRDDYLDDLFTKNTET